jgi:myo-inositol-1-phosphate synthase
LRHLFITVEREQKQRQGATNGDKKLHVAVIGVGNCESSLAPGIEFYQNARGGESVPGLMYVNLRGDHIRDNVFTAVLDINRTKAGKDRAEATFAAPTNTDKFAGVPSRRVKVNRGMTHDGLGKYLLWSIIKAPGPTDDISPGVDSHSAV